MKYLFILALVAACAAPKKEAINHPTESDATPVTAASIEPCICGKIYLPVCASGKDFGNPCEAQCEGHKTWKEGKCKK